MIITPKPTNVRIAIPRDEDQIYTVLSEGLFIENSTSGLSERKSREWIRGALAGQNYGIIGVIEENGEIAACIGLNLCAYWYSDDWHVEELWNFVAKPYRNHRSQDGSKSIRSFYATDLIDFAKWYSEYMQLFLMIGIITTKKMEAKCRLYSRILQPVGQFFIHNISVATGPGIKIEVK